MSKVPKKVKERFSKSLKSLQKIVENAKAKDVNEADTVTIVKDIFCDVLGYDKYEELTSEQAIRGTYVDLAVKIDSKVQLLIEVKAVGVDLKDNHVKQAVDYAANSGLEWVILTNSSEWQVFKVEFSKPIEAKLIKRFCFSELDLRKDEDTEALFVLCREGLKKSALDDFLTQHKATDKYNLGAALVSDSVLVAIRREIKRMHPDAKVDSDDIRDSLLSGVIKRDITESDEFKAAARLQKRKAKKKPSVKKASKESEDKQTEPEAITIKNVDNKEERVGA